MAHGSSRTSPPTSTRSTGSSSARSFVWRVVDGHRRAVTPPIHRNGSTLVKYFIVGAALWSVAVGGTAANRRGSVEHDYRAIDLSRSDRARASLRFQTGANGIDQKEVTMPWETTFTISPGVALYIAAQNVSDVGGIQVFILKNGREIATGEAVGEYATAIAEPDPDPSMTLGCDQTRRTAPFPGREGSASRGRVRRDGRAVAPPGARRELVRARIRVIEWAQPRRGCS